MATKFSPVVPPPKRDASLDVHATLNNLGRQVAERCGGGELWDKGLGDVVGNIVEQCNLPKRVSALDVGEALGLVKRKRGGR